MKMCSKRFISWINEDFLQWESSRHHLSWILGASRKKYSTWGKRVSLTFIQETAKEVKIDINDLNH